MPFGEQTQMLFAADFAGSVRLPVEGTNTRGVSACQDVGANSWTRTVMSPRSDSFLLSCPLCYIVAQEPKMPENTVVRARIDERIKNEAAAVLAAMGLTVSDAFRLMMVRIAKDKALPFEPLVPNEETIEAMRAARRGELTDVGSPDDLVAGLNEGD
jgi:DNA-damage-inducible protein J